MPRSRGCLSDRALLLVRAELGRREQRAHLAECPSCRERYGQLGGQLERIARVLVSTPEPAMRPVPSPRRWAAAGAGLSAAVGALLLVEVAAWHAFQAPSDLAASPQARLALAEVSSMLFSLTGEPPLARVEEVATESQAEVPEALGCEGAGWLVSLECDGGALEPSLELVEAEPPEAVDLGTLDTVDAQG